MIFLVILQAHDADSIIFFINSLGGGGKQGILSDSVIYHVI